MRGQGSVIAAALLLQLAGCGGAVVEEPSSPPDAGAKADAAANARAPRAGPTPDQLCRSPATRGQVVAGICLTDGRSCACNLAYGLRGCEKDDDCPLPQPCFLVNPQACYDYSCDGPGEPHYTPFGVCW